MRWLSAVLVLCGSFAVAAPLSAPRIGAYSGFTRLALDVPEGVTYTLEPLGAAFRANFFNASTTAATVKVGKPELRGYTLENKGNTAVLTMATPQGVSSRSGFRAYRLEATTGKTGYRLVFEFSGGFADVSKLVNPPALRLKQQPRQPFTVLLDPGHGGTDTGALGNGIKEAALNLEISLRVKTWLETIPGVRVSLTRTDNAVYSNDKRTDLNARAVASRGHTIFVSIHANAVPRASWNSQFGTEVYYYNPSNQKPLYVQPAAPLELTPSFAPEATTAPTAPDGTLPPDPSWIPEAGATTTTAPDETTSPPLNDKPTPLETPSPPPVTDEPTSPPPDTTSDTAPTTVTDTPPATEDSLPVTETPSPPIETMPTPVNFVLPGLDRISASKDLAGNVLSRMLYMMGSNNRGVRTADYYVIKFSECPAILIETGFVTHPIEAAQFKNPNYLERVSYGIASGLSAYLNGLLSPQ